MKVQLVKLAHARSGDKGDTANVGLIALQDELYPILVREVTAERVKQHFKGICHGEVERFELPNLGALNFLLHESLGGGGTLSLMTDAQGKTFSTALLLGGTKEHDRLASLRSSMRTLVVEREDSKEDWIVAGRGICRLDAETGRDRTDLC